MGERGEGDKRVDERDEERERNCRFWQLEFTCWFHGQPRNEDSVARLICG